MPLTISSVTKQQSTKNASDTSNEVFKTPLKNPNKTPKSSRKSENSTRTRCDSEPSSGSNSVEYICRVCKNTERLRLSLLDCSVETLLGKLNRADECFTDSIDKVESLSLNLRHFLVFNSEKAQTQQSLLSSIEKCINDLTNKTEVIEESIKKNEDRVASLNSAITEFRNFERKASSDCSNQLNNDHNIVSSNSFFSVDHLNRRVIKSAPPLLSNPTKHILEYEENFLNPDARLKINQFLDSCTDFVKISTMKTLNFGKTHNQPTRTNSNKEIPEPFRAIIDILHDKYSIQDEAKLNSVIINKFSGPHTKLVEHSFNDPSINPDSSIFTLSIGDSCPVVFRDKCTNETVDVNTTDNSIFMMSSKSQHYWTRKIDTPVISDSSVHYCITFTSVNRSNRNSTLIVGDSNTNHIYFSHEKNRSVLGRDIYGRRIQAFTIDEIEPINCIGFQNIVIQVGLNSLKNKYAEADGTIDIYGIFDRWLQTVITIKQLCPYSCFPDTTY